MSFLKTAILVVIILMLLPSNGDERYELYATAHRTVSDIGNFCNRNPDVCAKVSSAFSGMVDKLKSGADSIEDMLRDAGIGAPETRDEHGHSALSAQLSEPNVDYPTATAARASTDTLTKSDRHPDWRGPGH